MAAPTFGAVGTFRSNTSGTTILVPVPSGVVANSIVILMFYYENLGTVTTPAGFSVAPSSPIATGAGSHEIKQSVFWKRAVGPESGTYSVTVSASDYEEAIAVRYEGCVTSGSPFDVANSSARSSDASTSSPVSLTTTGTERRVVWIGTNWNSTAWTPPSGYSERYDGNDCFCVADKELPTAAATGSLTGTVNVADWSTAWVGALLPATIIETASAALTTTPSLVTQRPSEAIAANLTTTPSLTGGNPTPTVPANAALLTTPTLSQLTLIDSVAATLITTPVFVAGAKKIAWAQANLFTVPILYAGPKISRPPVHRTIYARPPLTHPFRVIAQHILTGEIVDWDLPVSEDFEYVRQLSGPTLMRGKFAPEIISVQELNLDGYAYWFHVEIDNEIRASAIFLPPQYEESSLTFSAEGITAIPHNVIYEGELVGIELDPLNIVRSIWTHVQAQPRSNYGVVISNHTSNVKLGTAAYTETTPPVPPETEPTVREVEAEPYELVWWDAVNCGAEIDSLAQETPFDYVERSKWNTAKTAVEYYVDLGFPRSGRAKPDLKFDEENILELVPIQEDEDSYASAVIVIGAGEGRDTIRGYSSVDFADRMRRTHVVTDKTVKTTDRANAMAVTELGIRRGRLFEISEIVIRSNHQNATLGEYDIGDDIEVSVDIPWLMGTYTAWYRITSISFMPSKDRVRLGLERSDSFRYPSVT